MTIAVVGPAPWRDVVVAAHRAAGADAYGIEASASELPSLLTELAPDVVGLELHPDLSVGVAGVTDLDDGLAKETAVRAVVAVQPTGSSRMLIGFNTLTSGIVRATQAVGVPLGSTLILGGRERAASALAAAVQLKARSISLAPSNVVGPGSAISAAHRLGVNVQSFRVEQLSGHLREFDSVLVCGEVPHVLDDELRDAGVAIVAVAPYAPAQVAYHSVLARQIEDAQRVLTGVNPDLRVIEQAVENFAV
ncbi:hypothetical protein P8A24_04805 [Arcanobacterium wilhelmae]|uniref:hypothetical protein n=1 Tax=Arcanobacterium wilhelmae TaxID=1803177 RepID=UPI002414F0EA|nr:hypothetical protein [Arcanobacterium wilhelmae]WFN89534.1 hypothetical protein P8A24_04805 [Arcanobacterium wilhelmae]